VQLLRLVVFTMTLTGKSIPQNCEEQCELCVVGA